jgi:predicted secreted protein
MATQFGTPKQINELIDLVGDMIEEDGADQEKIANLIGLANVTCLAYIATTLESIDNRLAGKRVQSRGLR